MDLHGSDAEFLLVAFVKYVRCFYSRHLFHDRDWTDVKRNCKTLNGAITAFVDAEAKHMKKDK